MLKKKVFLHLPAVIFLQMQPIDRFGYSAVVMKDYIYIIGGRNKLSGKLSAKVQKLKIDDPDGRWIPEANLTMPRAYAKAAVFRGKLPLCN